MKKSLIALAVLAASGASMAQSSVTMYGLVDAFVGATTTETLPGTKVTQTRVNSGGANTSRWGLRGTEDLGGGLKANFVLEQGFNIDNGAASSVQFDRQAFVGLSGGFGAVTLGRQYTAYFALHNATNNLGDNNLNTTSSPVTTLASGMRGVWDNGADRHQDRANNSIAYTSPVMSGLSGAVVYGFGEDKDTIVGSSKASYNASMHVKYANGPLLVGLAYQEELPVAPAATRNKIQNTLIAGSYDFGVAKLTGGFNMAKEGNIKDKEFQVGVSAPISSVVTVAAGYSNSKSEVGGVNSNKAQGLSLVGTYSLSKRTLVYAGLSNTNVKAAGGATLSKTSIVAAGVRHTF